jgi:N-acetylglucosaminyl-diphospho-decaprenol L-rhamnosyltransferase
VTEPDTTAAASASAAAAAGAAGPTGAAAAGAAGLAVVVVNHDAGDCLAGFLATVRSEGVTDVVVVDNASSDGSSDGVDDDGAVRVVRTGANLGYGSGANRGVAVTDAEFVVVANPDVVVHPGALGTLAAAFAADPTLAIAGPRIMGSDGVRYPSARRFPSAATAVGHALLGIVAPGNRFSRRYRMDDLDPTAPSAVDWVSGAFFMARRRAFAELGGFDESYFMYLEDLDLCWRAHRAGWTVAYVPGAVITHEQGLSTGRRPYSMLLAHHRSAFHFASSRAEGWHRLALPGVVLVLSARLLLAWARQAVTNVHRNEAPAD